MTFVRRLPGPAERPTAADSSRDLSVARLRASAPPLDWGYGAMSAITEGEIRLGYRSIAARTERCACSGTIRVEDASDASIARAVSVHNASTGHQRWRAWREEGG